MDRNGRKKFVVSEIDEFAASVSPDLCETDRKMLEAVADLIGHTGATAFEIGFTGDDPDSPGWFAYAQYPGSRITVEDHPGPVQAASALASRLLVGARCRCGRTVALFGVEFKHPEGSYYHAKNREGIDLSNAPTREGFCNWSLIDDRFTPGCSEDESVW